MSTSTERDPGDLTQYVILKHWQFWLYFTMMFVAGALLGFATAAAGRAHADPAMCQFLGQNYDVTFNCLAPQPWLPYGTGNNPPLGGSAVTPGGDGPTVNGREPGWSGPNCRACSS